MNEAEKAYPEVFSHSEFGAEVSPHTHEAPPPGETCPTCSRRIPFPKKKTSPTTRVYSIRVPADDLDALKEVIEAASYAQDPLRDGALVRERPHYVYWTIFFALAEWLQEHVA